MLIIQYRWLPYLDRNDMIILLLAHDYKFPSKDHPSFPPPLFLPFVMDQIMERREGLATGGVTTGANYSPQLLDMI